VDQERKKVCDVTASFAWNLLREEEKSELAGHAVESVPAFVHGYEDSAGQENFFGAARSGSSDNSGDSQAC
jgi:hypothetical protein